MHSAVRPQDEHLAHDPYDAANDNIAELQSPNTTRMPSDKILAHLFTGGYIGQDERDAGEHTIKLASIARSPLKSAVVRYTVRDADRKWRPIEEQRHTIRPKLEALIASVRYEPRRKAFTQAFVVDDSNLDLANPHRAAQGLADAARHLWGTPKAAAPIMVADNDNEPTPDEAVASGTARVVADGFKRMHSSKQLDDDAETNDILHAAGMRYAQDHHLAGLNPLGAIDYSRTQVDYGSSDGMPQRMAQARDSFRKAREAMGQRYGAVVDAVVIEGGTLLDIGSKVTTYKDKSQSRAAVAERLNAGLRCLAAHYGIMR